jgi:hypothetical protein
MCKISLKFDYSTQSYIESFRNNIIAYRDIITKT